VTRCCECGDEPSGSGVTESVICGASVCLVVWDVVFNDTICTKSTFPFIFPKS
jgi:hypothetical protein